MSLPPDPGLRPMDEILAEYAKPYEYPLTWEATFSPRDAWYGPRWKVKARDAKGRLAGSGRSRWLWRAKRHAQHDIDIHEGRAASPYKRKDWTTDGIR